MRAEWSHVGQLGDRLFVSLFGACAGADEFAIALLEMLGQLVYEGRFGGRREASGASRSLKRFFQSGIGHMSVSLI